MVEFGAPGVNPGKTNIEIAASLHFLAHNGTVAVEVFRAPVAPAIGMTEEQIDVSGDGCVEVPGTPGLGVHLTQQTIDNYPNVRNSSGLTS